MESQDFLKKIEKVQVKDEVQSEDDSSGMETRITPIFPERKDDSRQYRIPEIEPFNPKGNIKTYIEKFEILLKATNIPKSRWSAILATKLSPSSYTFINCNLLHLGLNGSIESGQKENDQTFYSKE